MKHGDLSWELQDPCLAVSLSGGSNSITPGVQWVLKAPVQSLSQAIRTWLVQTPEGVIRFTHLRVKIHYTTL